MFMQNFIKLSAAVHEFMSKAVSAATPKLLNGQWTSSGNVPPVSLLSVVIVPVQHTTQYW